MPLILIKTLDITLNLLFHIYVQLQDDANVKCTKLVVQYKANNNYANQHLYI